MHELILGGAKSSKSRTAEARAARWQQAPGHEALLIATALAGDGEMDGRIARHRADRAARQPPLACVELAGGDLASTLLQHARPQRLLVVDCLTLWLTQRALPLAGPAAEAAELDADRSALVQALREAPGPVVLVSNEIGLGVMPLGVETRRFIDLLGLLHQAVAACCTRVTLMLAGQELAVKGTGPHA